MATDAHPGLAKTTLRISLTSHPAQALPREPSMGGPPGPTALPAAKCDSYPALFLAFHLRKKQDTQMTNWIHKSCLTILASALLLPPSRFGLRHFRHGTIRGRTLLLFKPNAFWRLRRCFRRRAPSSGGSVRNTVPCSRSDPFRWPR